MKCMAPSLPVFFLFFTYLGSAQNNVFSIDRFSSDPEKSIVINTENSENHKTLLAAMIASDMDKILEYDGPYTVFAPSDRAFERLSDIEMKSLLDPKNKKKLRQVISYHIVAGNFSASKILRAMCRGNGRATFTTVQGDDITATMDGIDIILTDVQGNTARITTADSNQCNGVIHEIDSVILPSQL